MQMIQGQRQGQEPSIESLEKVGMRIRHYQRVDDLGSDPVQRIQIILL